MERTMNDHDEQGEQGEDEDSENGVAALTVADLTPKFGTMAPLAVMAHDAYRAYCLAHAAKFGRETPKFTAWKEALPAVDVTAFVQTPADMVDDWTDEDGEPLPVANLADACRLSSDAAYVASLIDYLSEMLTLARENLQGIYYSAKRSGNVDTSDVAALRANLDSLVGALVKVSETDQLDAAAIWSTFPYKVRTNKKTGAKRTELDVPNIPTTRKVDALRKNARLSIVAELSPQSGRYETVAGEDFGEQCKSLGMTIGELRERYGVEVDTPHTLPTGRCFILRKIER
jgi:hypothetical protein